MRNKIVINMPIVAGVRDVSVGANFVWKNKFYTMVDVSHPKGAKALNKETNRNEVIGWAARVSLFTQDYNPVVGG